MNDWAIWSLFLCKKKKKKHIAQCVFRECITEYDSHRFTKPVRVRQLSICTLRRTRQNEHIFLFFFFAAFFTIRWCDDTTTRFLSPISVELHRASILEGKPGRRAANRRFVSTFSFLATGASARDCLNCDSRTLLLQNRVERKDGNDRVGCWNGNAL